MLIHLKLVSIAKNDVIVIADQIKNWCLDVAALRQSVDMELILNFPITAHMLFGNHSNEFVPVYWMLFI